MKIKFITTGGTIDKDYASHAGTYNFEISEPAIRRVLEQVNANFEFEITSVLKKDSLDMDDTDRQLIFDVCKDLKDERLIITHGTDTMVQTAQKLRDIENKIIILVGSSKPERFKDSDAPFNLGVAIGAINCLEEGVYIAMNGRVYRWDECEKESKSGQFIEN